MRFAALFAAFLAVACSDDPAETMMMTDQPPESGGSGVEPLAPPAEGEGFQMKMEVTAPAGEETWKCLIFEELDFAGPVANIQRATSRMTDTVHHMDIMSLALTNLTFEPGMYDCKDLYRDNAEAIMDQGLILVASQLGEQEYVLPEGVVAQVPRRSLYLYELHYVNTTDKDMKLASYVNAYTIPSSKVKGTIWGGPVRDRNINVPARTQEHVEWSRCVMNKPVDVIFVSSHTHELAKSFEIRYFDGQEVNPELLYENRDWESPFLRNFDPPMHLEAGQGFEFRCIYASNRDTETHWGLTAMDEMCQIGVVFTPGDTDVACSVVETSDNVIHQ